MTRLNSDKSLIPQRFRTIWTWFGMFVSYPMFILVTMTTKYTTMTPATPETTQPQLLLVLDTATETAHWKLDDETREIGRQGLAKARAALQAARPAPLDMAA